MMPAGAGRSAWCASARSPTAAPDSGWLEQMFGPVAEYQRRSAKERTHEAQVLAVARGATPFARVPIGYQRQDDGTLAPDPDTVPVAVKAFEMRAAGDSMKDIRDMLRVSGIDRSIRGVQTMLTNRLYIGELHYGEMVNLNACEPIIDRDTFRRVGSMIIPRGPKPKSPRLLARLRILRCGNCGAALSSMVIPRGGAAGHRNDYPVYRCASSNECSRHVMISARIAENAVADAVKAALAGSTATVSLDTKDAAQALAWAQAALDAAISNFTAAGVDAEPAVVAKLKRLRDDRDEAQQRVDRIAPTSSITINGATDWDRLSQDGQRAVIAAVVESATVASGTRYRDGRGAGRIVIKLRPD